MAKDTTVRYECDNCGKVEEVPRYGGLLFGWRESRPIGNVFREEDDQESKQFCTWICESEYGAKIPSSRPMNLNGR